MFNAWKADRPTGFIDNSEDVPVTVAALIPSSHRSELEQRVGRVPTRKCNGAAEAENRAQALKAELSKANLKLEEARKYKEQAELARNAEELKRARREKEAAEVARAAAAEEAEQIIQQYKETHALSREREDEKFRAERGRLEAESADLREALQQSRGEREEALGLQAKAEEQIEELAEISKVGAESEQIKLDIAALEEAAKRAREAAESADEAQRKVQAAADANREFMEQKQSAENDSRDGIEGEIAGWLAEQEALETSNLQQQILSNQKVHLQMDKGTGAVRKGSRQASRSVAYRRIGKSSG